jgi:hypothetical protein
MRFGWMALVLAAGCGAPGADAEEPAPRGAFDQVVPAEWLGTWVVKSGKVACPPLVPEFDVAGPPRLPLVATVLRPAAETTDAPLVSHVVKDAEDCLFAFDLDASGHHATVRPSTCRWRDPMNGDVALVNRHETLDLLRDADGALAIHSIVPEQPETLVFAAGPSCAYRQDVIVVPASP